MTARYEARRNPAAPPETPWSVWDSATGAFVTDQRHASWAGAHQAAGAHNRALAAAHAEGGERCG